MHRGTIDQARLAWRLIRDPRVSPLKYAIPALLFAYLASPVDLIPDLLLGLGQADDVGVAVLAIMVMIRAIPLLAPEHIVRDHLRDMGLADHAAERNQNDSAQAIDAQFSVRN